MFALAVTFALDTYHIRPRPGTCEHPPGQTKVASERNAPATPMANHAPSSTGWRYWLMTKSLRGTSRLPQAR